MNKKPIIAISMGDPFGNGPEITVKALSDEHLYETCRPVVVGDASCMEYACRIARKVSGIDLQIHVISEVNEARFTYGTIDLIDMNKVPSSSIPDHSAEDFPAAFGVGACALGGEAAFSYVTTVIALAMKGLVDGTVTNAISKESINMAGHHYSGHTEIYADYTGTKRYAMMLAHHDFRVVHVSTHVSLREACDRVKKDRVLECIQLAAEACKDMGIANPKVAVAGLNPHCGENGLFGTEEIDEIQPAIEAAKEQGIEVLGPLPPDSIFSQAIGGWYDIVVVMYHDQGHIPMKTVGFVYDREKQDWKAVEGVNITLGLPIIRVSVDHGTGWAFAGTGKSNELSLVNAIDYAAKLAMGKLA